MPPNRNDETIGVEAALDLMGWTRNVSVMLGDADKIDAALHKIVSATGDVEAALNRVGSSSVSVKVTADTSTALNDLAAIESLATPVKVVVTADDADLKAAVDLRDSLNQNTNLTASANDTDIKTATSLRDLLTENTGFTASATTGDLDTAKQKHDDLNANTSFRAGTDSAEIDAAKRKHDDLNENTSFTVNATLSGQDAETLKRLTAMQTLQLALELTGPGVGVLQQAYSLLTANEDAMALLEARTNTLFEGADEALTNIYVATGVGRDEIAKTLALAQSLKIDPEAIEGASQQAIVFAQIWDEDVNAAITAANQLVKTGLAKDFGEAFDILQTGFETGANRGDDFLDTIREYSSTFADLGLTAGETLSVINTGLEGGFDVSDRVADLFREFNIRASNPNETAAQDALRAIGMGDEAKAFQAGEITGAEFFKGVLAALQTKDPGKQQALAADIFGTQIEDFSLSTLFSVDPVNTYFDTIEGRSRTASTEFSNTIGATVGTFFRDVQTEAEAFLSSDQLGLQTKLDTLKDQLSGTMAALSEGEDLGTALEIGFKVEGVQEAMDRLQSIAGNLAVGFLESVAAIQDFLGRDSSGTRGEIARLAEGQFAFDLKIANEDEIANVVSTALSRGVDIETISRNVGVAVDELLAGGQVGAAQNLLDQLQSASGGFVLSPTVDTSKIDGMAIQQLFDNLVETGDVEALRALVEEGLVIAPDIDTGVLEEKITLTATTLREKFDDALATGDIEGATRIAEQLGDEDLIAQAEVAAEAWAEMQEQVMDSADQMALASNNATQEVEGDMLAIGEASRRADEAVTQAVSGGSIVPEFHKIKDAALADFPIVASEMATLDAAAKTHLGGVSSWAKIAAGSLMGFGNTWAILDGTITRLTQIGSAASSATGAVNGAAAASTPSTPVVAMAEGGTASGVFVAGERGAELISTDERVAVLNNRVSGDITRAVHSVLGGMGVTNNNKSVTLNLNQVNYIQSQAQVDSLAWQTANAVRGF